MVSNLPIYEHTYHLLYKFGSEEFRSVGQPFRVKAKLSGHHAKICHENGEFRAEGAAARAPLGAFEGLPEELCLAAVYLIFKIWIYIPYSGMESEKEGLHCRGKFFAGDSRMLTPQRKRPWANAAVPRQAMVVE